MLRHQTPVGGHQSCLRELNELRQPCSPVFRLESGLQDLALYQRRCQFNQTVSSNKAGFQLWKFEDVVDRKTVTSS